MGEFRKGKKKELGEGANGVRPWGDLLPSVRRENLGGKKKKNRKIQC